MFHELRLFPDWPSRIYAVVAAMRDVYLVRRYMSPGMLLGVGLALLLLNWVPVVWPRAVSVLGYAVFVSLAWAVIASVVLWPVVRSFRRSLRRQLALGGVPVCWACGYDLRGNREGQRVCSECGADCDDLAGRLQRFLPEAETFPELRGFSSEAEALGALDHARARLGLPYRHRLLIASGLSIGTAIVWMVVFELVDGESLLADRPELRHAVVLSGMAVSVSALIGWYVRVWRHIRRGLRSLLAERGQALPCGGTANATGQA